MISFRAAGVLSSVFFLVAMVGQGQSGDRFRQPSDENSVATATGVNPADASEHSAASSQRAMRQQSPATSAKNPSPQRSATEPGLLTHLLSPGRGWTAFKPSPDTRMIYVSSSLGKDSSDGLSPTRPLKSIALGFALLRNDHSDWLLLKRGDTWHEPIGSITARKLKNGRSMKQPTLIAYIRKGFALRK